MNKYTIIQGNKTILENTTIEQFLDYIEDTDYYLGWLVANGYDYVYGRKVMQHFLNTYDRCINVYNGTFVHLDYEFYLEQEEDYEDNNC